MTVKLDVGTISVNTQDDQQNIYRLLKHTFNSTRNFSTLK